MSEATISIEDAAASLSDLVERVHAGREPIVIVKSGMPMVRMVPVPAPSDGLIAFLSRWRREHPDPDEQFAEIIQESRKAVQPPQDPWE